MDLEQYGIKMWSEEKIASFQEKLLAWYDKEKRDLPWRHTNNPYHIWVSEIMLQQTRVDTVIPYYYRFLETFPTIESLANAQEEELLKVWEGLGYYSRVRNMQKAAQQIIDQYSGEFPSTMEEIQTLKGIGPYTAGAIASIAFNLPEPAVDGNLMRVISRLFEIGLDIGNPTNRKVFQAVAEKIISKERPGDFNQALMDLGSDIESPVTPHPEDSPVKEFSAAYINGTMHLYPVKIPKKKPVSMKWQAFVIQNEKGQYLLEKNTYADLLSGFWHFPLIRDYTPTRKQLSLLEEIAEEVEEYPNKNIPMEKQFESIYQMKVQKIKKIKGEVKHIFSHQKWEIELTKYNIDSKRIVEEINGRELRWIEAEEFIKIPFSKVQMKLWEHVRLQEE